jgi:hypothetical protein
VAFGGAGFELVGLGIIGLVRLVPLDSALLKAGMEGTVPLRAVASGAKAVVEVIFGKELLGIVAIGRVPLTAIPKEEVLSAAIVAEAKVLTVVVLTGDVVDMTMVATEPLKATPTGLVFAIAVVKEGEMLEMGLGTVPLEAVSADLVLFAKVVVGSTGLLELAALVLLVLSVTASGADTLGAITEGVIATIVDVKVCIALILKILP